MNRGAKQWMWHHRDVVQLLPPPGETWRIEDIREDDDEGVLRNGQALTSRGIIRIVDRPGYSKACSYVTDPDAYEYVQEKLNGGDSGGLR